MKIKCIKENVNFSDFKEGEVYELIYYKKNGSSKIRIDETSVVIIPSILYNSMFELV